MLNLTVDQTSIGATIVANILLNLSIHIQKYTKKQILHLALHGTSDISLKHLWVIGLSFLVAAECSYFVAFGIGPTNTQLSSLTVFSFISNIVLPPLFFENHKHTITGSLMSQLGILVLILTSTNNQNSNNPEFGWNDQSTKAAIAGELLLGIVFIIIRYNRPANCSLRLCANCGISSLMGSHVVTAIKIMMAIPDSSKLQSLLLAVIAVSFVLELTLITESLQLFSAFQVVPHHFVMFTTLVFFNNSVVFRSSSGSPMSINLIVTSLAYALMNIGVWTAAKPHLDIPVTIADSGILPELEQRVYHRWNDMLPQRAALSSNDSGCCALDTQWGHRCLREEYCGMTHQAMVDGNI